MTVDLYRCLACVYWNGHGCNITACIYSEIKEELKNDKNRKKVKKETLCHLKYLMD